MESSKSPDRRSSRRCFAPDALARVLSEELHLTPDVPLYVAYSGGMDSHVLLHALAGLRVRTPWRLTAVHIDHGLHPAAPAWSRHCAEVCGALDVPYRSERVVVQETATRGLEDAARRARYGALRGIVPAGAVLLTAHHRSDQAETLLLQLLRGAGVPGLAAMPAIAGFGRARLGRPLLGFARATIAAYARTHALHWIEDPSNDDTRLARNFLRRRVLPALAERWPQAEKGIVRAARHQAEAARLLDELGRIDLTAAQTPAGELSVAALQVLTPERQANLLRYWIRTRGFAAPSQVVLERVLAHTKREPTTRHAAVCWAGAELRRYRDRLVMLDPASPAPADWEAMWDPATVLPLPGGLQLRAEARHGTGISPARIAGRALRVTMRRGGERCLLRGHHQKVKKLLQAAGIPPWERARLPLVYVDDELAAIGAHWVCDAVAARGDEPGLAFIVERVDARPSG